ncbi:MAG: hypothetical protein E7G36_00300 [Peptoniphilus rhinitidis]|uniref:hypothetical protein n=1 Tax=Peptoniphilus rhinitidis TaxID=1175452 RepID=UPI002900FF97|nr:hypothetical protein [Peptoniphilus rhinitidis]MDU2109004.1 hypothetical protein [Peptoniphilus lacydonensis]MDU3750144.1 hypothetical protein [Peptoniphilus rhinitidis]
MKNKSDIVILNHESLTRLPILKVKDNYSKNKNTRILGSNSHDSYILGKDKGLHYYNLQCSEGTEFGGYEFVLDEDDDDYMKYFETANFIDLMDIDAKRLNLENNEKYLNLKKEIVDLFEKSLEEKDEKTKDTLIEIIEDYKKENNIK